MENCMENTTNLLNISIQADNLNSFVLKKSGEIKWKYKNPERSQTFSCTDTIENIEDLFDSSSQSSDVTELRALSFKRSGPLSLTYNITTGTVTNDQDHTNLTYVTKGVTLLKGERELNLETPGCSWNHDLKQFDGTIYTASENVNDNRERITSEDSINSRPSRGPIGGEPSDYISFSDSEHQKAVRLTILHNTEKLHNEINSSEDKARNTDHSAQTQEKKGETYRTHNNLTSDTGTSFVNKGTDPDSDQSNAKWKALCSNVNEPVVNYSVTKSCDANETTENRNLLHTHSVVMNHQEFADERQGIWRFPINNVAGCPESKCACCGMRDDSLCLPSVEECDIFDFRRYLYSNRKPTNFPCRNKNIYVHNLIPCVEGITSGNHQSVQPFERGSSLLNPENCKENWHSINPCNSDENHTMGNGTIEKRRKDNINPTLGITIKPNIYISKSQGSFTDTQTFCCSFFNKEVKNFDPVPSLSIDNEPNEGSMVNIPVKMLESRITKGMHYGNSEAIKVDCYDKVLINSGTPLITAVKSSGIQHEVQNKVDNSAAHKKIIRHFLNKNVENSDVSFLSTNLNDSSEYITGNEYDVFPHPIINKSANKTLTLQEEDKKLYLNNIKDTTPEKDMQSQNVTRNTETLIPTLKTILPVKYNHESVNSTLNKTCNNIDILNRGNTSQNNGSYAMDKGIEYKWICSNPFCPSSISNRMCEYANAPNPHDYISSNPQSIIEKGFNNIDDVEEYLQSAFCKRTCHFDNDKDIPKETEVELELESIKQLNNTNNVTQKREDCSGSSSKTLILRNHNNSEHVRNSIHLTPFPHNNTKRNESSLNCILIGIEESAILHSTSALSREKYDIHNSQEKIWFGLKSRDKTTPNLKNFENVCNLSSDGIIIISLEPQRMRKDIYKSGVSQLYFEYREVVYTNPIVMPVVTLKVKRSLSERKYLCYSKDNVSLILNNDGKSTKKSLLSDTEVHQQFGTEINSKLPKKYPNLDAKECHLGEEKEYDYHDETKGENLFNSSPNRKHQSERKIVSVDYEKEDENDCGRRIENVNLKHYKEYSYSLSSSHTFKQQTSEEWKKEPVFESSDKLPSLDTISSQESANRHEPRKHSSKRSSCKRHGKKKCPVHRKHGDKHDKENVHGRKHKTHRSPHKKLESSRAISGNVTPSSRSCEIELTSIQYEDIPDPIVSLSSQDSFDQDLRYYDCSVEQVGLLGSISNRAKRALSDGQRAISSGINSFTTKMFCLFNRTTPKR